MKLMDEATQLALLWRLVDATDAGMLTWRKAEDDEYCFDVWVGDFAYEISSVDRDDWQPYEFRIFRKDPKDPDGDAPHLETWNTRSDESLIDPLYSLYQAVKRKVMGYENLVVDMFSSLAQLDGGSATPPGLADQKPREGSRRPNEADPWDVTGDEAPF